MNIGQRLKKLRKSLDLTQREFAQKIPGKGDYTYIGKIERGHQYPSIKFLEKICKIFGVPMSYFFEDHSETTRKMIGYLDLLDWFSKEENIRQLKRFFRESAMKAKKSRVNECR